MLADSVEDALHGTGDGHRLQCATMSKAQARPLRPGLGAGSATPALQSSSSGSHCGKRASHVKGLGTSQPPEEGVRGGRG